LFLGNEPGFATLFPRNDAKPLPKIGVWRARTENGAHDDARPALRESVSIPLRAPPGRESFRGGSPRNVDSQASDADAIGIYPVHTGWTVVDSAATPVAN